MKLELVRKLSVSAFILLNLAATLAVNSFVIRWPSRMTEIREPRAALVAPIREDAQGLTGWLKQYARSVGLHGEWVMFAVPPRAQWWPTFKAVYGDQSEVWLPLPTQVHRDFWERRFFDFRETKFLWNIFIEDPGPRRSYVSYLCREFANQRELPAIRRIRIEQYVRNILPPEEAIRRGTYLAPGPEHLSPEEYPCSDPSVPRS